MAKELPYYTSQKQAAAAVSVPVELIRQACTEDPSITRSAGRIDKQQLAAWLKDYAWKKQAPAGEGSDDAPLDGRSLIEIKRLREIVALKREELALDKARDAMLPVADFEAAFSATLSAFRATLNALPGRAAGKIVQRGRAAILAMLKDALAPKTYAKIEATVHAAPIDYADMEEILQHETDLVLRTLEECKYLPSPDTPAAA